METRRSIFLSLLFSLLVGCGEMPREFQLDEKSFGVDQLETLSEVSGISFPAGSNGLRYHYLPPIDPIHFAEIEIPSSKREEILELLGSLNELESLPGSNFDTFANNRCRWWPDPPKNVLLRKRCQPNGSYVDVFLIEVDGRLLLFVKCFTI